MKFKDGDRVRAVSSDRSGYNYAKIVSINSVCEVYGVVWESLNTKVSYYDAKDVEDIWEFVQGESLPRGIDFTLNHGIVATADGACDHVWAEYNGFSESFKFCQKCDEKKYDY